VPGSLSPAYLDHLVSPRHRGDLAAPHAVGEAGTALVGTGVRISLRFRRPFLRAERVEAASFRVLGGPAAVAPASWVVERVVGLSRAEAAAIAEADVLAALPGAPAPVAHAARLVVAALRAALSPAGREAVRSPGVLVCRCFVVSDRAVRAAARAGARTVPEVSEACDAGRGCHSCWPDVRAILDDETEPAVVPDADLPPLLRVVEAVVRPAWRAQGVRLGRAAVEGDVVFLEAREPAPGALASEVGAVAIARRLLAEVLGDAVRVEPLRLTFGSGRPD
jgi:bacterioferritin-associated ferredoxin